LTVPVQVIHLAGIVVMHTNSQVGATLPLEVARDEGQTSSVKAATRCCPSFLAACAAGPAWIW